MPTRRYQRHVFFIHGIRQDVGNVRSEKFWEKFYHKKKKKKRSTWQRRLLSVMSIGATTAPGCRSWATAHSAHTAHVHAQGMLTRQFFFFSAIFLSFYLHLYTIRTEIVWNSKRKMFWLCDSEETEKTLFFFLPIMTLHFFPPP